MKDIFSIKSNIIIEKEVVSKKPSWLVISALVFIIAISIFLCFYQIGKLSLWGDEIATMIFINHNPQDMLKFLWPREMNMSLYYFISNIWAHLFTNPSEGTLRIISAIFSVVSVPLVFLLGRTISKDRKIANITGLIAALLVSLNSFNIQYAQELRSYSLVVLLSTLSTFLLVKIIENPNSIKLWIGYIFVSIAGVYSQYFFAFLVLSQAVSLLFLLIGENIHNLPIKKIVISYFVIALFIVPIIIAALLTGTASLSWLIKPTFSSILQFAIEIAGNQGMQLLILYIITGFIGLLVGVEWNKKDIFKKWVAVLFLSCLFIPVIIVILLSEIYTPLFHSRYFIFCIPFLSIFAAFGITKLIYMKQFILKLIGVLLLILMIVFSLIGVRFYFNNFQKEEWRDVSEFLTVNCGRQEDFRLYYSSWTQNFSSYYNNKLKTQNEDLENASSDLNSDQISSWVPEGTSKVCLVLSENLEARHVLQTKIIQSGIKIKYPRVTIYKFFGIDVNIYEKL